MYSQLLTLLQAKSFTLATAESCTGGAVSAAVTDIAGISQVYNGGVVSYSNEAKMNLLKVPENILIQYGAVSEECAGFMAKGAAAALQSTCAISTTGIAGPTGAVPGKPVGTVCIGYFINGRLYTETNHFGGDRHAVRQAALHRAMTRLIELLQNM